MTPNTDNRATVDYIITTFVASPETRKKVYAILFALGLAVTAIFLFCAAEGLPVPAGAMGVNAVFNSLFAAGFLMAIGNTSTKGTEVAPVAPVEVVEVEEVAPAELSEADRITAEFQETLYADPTVTKP